MKKILGIRKEILACIICIPIVSTGALTMHFEQEPMGIANNLRGNSNLLKNPGFENDTDNDNMPDYWNVFPPSPPGVIYSWDSMVSHTGAHSVCIESTNTGMAMWQQIVSVMGGTFYTFAGYCKLKNVVSPNGCKFQLVWRDSANNIISSFDLPGHTNTIDWIYDNPHEVFLLSPIDAVKVEVNCILENHGKVWFDDIYFGLTPVGNISGIVTCGGSPVEDARVYVLGVPHGIKYEAWTDVNGYYILHNVPVASPRYILVASKSSYMDTQKGDIMVFQGEKTVDFEMYKGSNFPDRELTVKFVQFVKQEESPLVNVSLDAVIDPSLYPASIQPYLLPSEYLESNDDTIIHIANQILATIAPENRTNLSQVAYAVYLWIIKNIEYDVYDLYSYDATSGSWQTISGEAWSWGHNFTDWLYTATEILEQRRGICIEHSRLPAAILRALNIPARPVVGYGTQYWVQLPSGEGYWAYMSTVKGRSAYRMKGDIWAGFRETRAGEHKIWRVDQHPPVHSDWCTKNKCAWRETHPWSNRYKNSSSGYNQAVADLQLFEETGNLPRRPSVSSGSCYTLDYADFTLNLTNIGSQKIFRTRFPIIIDTEYTHHLTQAYWTDHPECVTQTWIEEINNLPVPDTWRWFYIEFNLTNLTGRKDTHPPIVEIIKPRDRYLYVFDREIMPISSIKSLLIGKITVEVDAYDENGIDRIEFYIDDKVKYVDEEYPYSCFGMKKLLEDMK